MTWTKSRFERVQHADGWFSKKRTALLSLHSGENAAVGRVSIEPGCRLNVEGSSPTPRTRLAERMMSPILKARPDDVACSSESCSAGCANFCISPR